MPYIERMKGGEWVPATNPERKTAMMTNSEFFKAAHKVARETRANFVTYRMAFSAALRKLYAQERAEKENAVLPAGRYSYDPYYQDVCTGKGMDKPCCEYEAEAFYYGGTHYYVKRATATASALKGRGITFDPANDEYRLTPLAFDDLCKTHSVRFIFDSMR